METRSVEIYWKSSASEWQASVSPVSIDDRTFLDINVTEDNPGNKMLSCIRIPMEEFVMALRELGLIDVSGACLRFSAIRSQLLAGARPCLPLLSKILYEPQRCPDFSAVNSSHHCFTESELRDFSAAIRTAAALTFSEFVTSYPPEQEVT